MFSKDLLVSTTFQNAVEIRRLKIDKIKELVSIRTADKETDKRWWLARRNAVCSAQSYKPWIPDMLQVARRERYTLSEFRRLTDR